MYAEIRGHHQVPAAQQDHAHQALSVTFVGALAWCPVEGVVGWVVGGVVVGCWRWCGGL